ncbi:MAG: hypothetical protein WDO24_11500 [Pseudomonadota bacterium]
MFRALLIAALLLVPTIAARSQTRPSNDAQAPGKDVLLSAAPAWDLDHDGIYTCDEWKQYARRLFNMAASTHDGFIGRQEFEVVRRADAIFADADFDDFDANRDGRLSESEFVDKPSPFFARYDRSLPMNSRAGLPRPINRVREEAAIDARVRPDGPWRQCPVRSIHRRTRAIARTPSPPRMTKKFRALLRSRSYSSSVVNFIALAHRDNASPLGESSEARSAT